MFLNLSKIKCEIKDDLGRLDKIINDIQLNEVYTNNQDMSIKMNKLSNDFKEQLLGLNNKNKQLEKDIIKLQNENASKDMFKIDLLCKLENK
mgnify:CR=1 FL=1